MARKGRPRFTSGSPSGGRRSSFRKSGPAGSGKSFGKPRFKDRAGDKDQTPRGERKSSPGGFGKPKPFNRSEGRTGGARFGGGRPGRGGSEGDRPNSRPFSKDGFKGRRDSGDQDKRFGKRENFSSGDRPFRGSPGDRPNSRPFSKDKFKGRSDEGDQNKRFGKRDYGSGDRPFRGSQGDRPKPYPKDRFKGKDDGSDQKKRFSKSENPSAGDRPNRSGSDGDRRKPFAKDRFKGRGDERSDRPGKRFGKREDDSSSEKKPYVRKSFVESRIENQKRSLKQEEPAAAPKDGLIRLNKYISNSGVCSRREADNLITMGLITVNGKSVTELGYKVKATDDVRYEGKKLQAEKPVYILLNKPKGFITTTDDPQERNTVMHLIHGACKERVYPVGRLDRNTSGLLLLTNDGELTDKLTHPSYGVKKIYKAELDRPLTKADFQKIRDGVALEEGRAIVDDLAIVSDDGKTVGLEVHIGWNRLVRRIFEALNYDVVKLDRSVYATLDKKELSRGQWRFLREDEIIRLKHFQ